MRSTLILVLHDRKESVEGEEDPEEKEEDEEEKEEDRPWEAAANFHSVLVLRC